MFSLFIYFKILYDCLTVYSSLLLTVCTHCDSFPMCTLYTRYELTLMNISTVKTTVNT